MKAWKSNLPADDICKVIAFESTFGLKGKEYCVDGKIWIPQGSDCVAAVEAAPAAAGEAVPADGKATESSSK